MRISFFKSGGEDEDEQKPPLRDLSNHQENDQLAVATLRKVNRPTIIQINYVHTAKFKMRISFFKSGGEGKCEQTPKNDNFDCLVCYDAHHGEWCQRMNDRCFECHVHVKDMNDHADNCNVRNWYKSQAYVDMYVTIPGVRATITFAESIFYTLDGEFIEAKPDVELFSDMADVLFKFASKSKIVLQTTGFTRIRLPVVVRDKNHIISERIVFMTSHDRTMVAANSSRTVNQSNVLADFEHMTPLVLFLPGGCTKLILNVNSGGKDYVYNINVSSDGKKFIIPTDLDVNSKHFSPKPFDAAIQLKKFKRQ